MLILCESCKLKRARLHKSTPLVNPAALIAMQEVLSSSS